MRWKSALIKKGKHRSTISWKPFFGKGKVFTFSFNESARYDLGKPYQLSVNKLIGFTDGCLNHHSNSFRIGWRYDATDDRVEILAYTYVDGVRDFKVIHKVGLFDTTQCRVSCEKNAYRILINGYKIEYMPRSRNIKWKYKHMLWPYFGGQVAAPRPIFIMFHYKRLSKV